MLDDFSVYPVAIDIYPEAHQGSSWDWAPFRHRSGWLSVWSARLDLPCGSWRGCLFAAASDKGEIYRPHIAAQLLRLPVSLPRDAEIDPPDCLDDLKDEAAAKFRRDTQRDLALFLEDAEARVTGRIKAAEEKCLVAEGKLASIMRSLRAERRRDETTASRRSAIDARLGGLAALSDQMAGALRAEAAGLRETTLGLARTIAEIEDDDFERDHLYTLNWTMRSRRDDPGLRLPIQMAETVGGRVSIRHLNDPSRGELDTQLAAIRFAWKVRRRVSRRNRQAILDRSNRRPH
jgi:hypothetical protein